MHRTQGGGGVWSDQIQSHIQKLWSMGTILIPLGLAMNWTTIQQTICSFSYGGVCKKRSAVVSVAFSYCGWNSLLLGHTPSITLSLGIVWNGSFCGPMMQQIANCIGGGWVLFMGGQQNAHVWPSVNAMGHAWAHPNTWYQLVSPTWR